MTKPTVTAARIARHDYTEGCALVWAEVWHDPCYGRKVGHTQPKWWLRAQYSRRVSGDSAVFLRKSTTVAATAAEWIADMTNAPAA